MQLYSVKKYYLNIFLFIIILVSHPTSTYAQKSLQKIRNEFPVWLSSFKKSALDNGISQKIIDKAFKNVKLRLKLPDLNIPKKTKKKKVKRQPEFDSPGKYFPKSYLQTLTKQSRKHYQKWQKSLIKIEEIYNVDAKIILSIWGRETAFGKAKIPHYAIEVLATQAYIGNRKEFFKTQLMLALQILQEGHIIPKKMKSSWAGAMGYTQFMPEDFVKYAVDFDKDGRKDIWGTIPDALASTANYLNKNGWQNDFSWGYEVDLPQNFDCRYEGFGKGRTIKEWLSLGISFHKKTELQPNLLKNQAYLLIPAGTKGPAFLVLDNFLVIKTYNQSNLYALFIGHLADRTQINKTFKTKWPKLKSYSRQKIREMQKQLALLGYDIGKIDGIVGPKSRSIIGMFQHKNNTPITCYPNEAMFTILSKQTRKLEKSG